MPPWVASVSALLSIRQVPQQEQERVWVLAQGPPEG